MAVAIVADLSSQMNDRGTPLNNTRFDDMQSLLQSLMPRLLLPNPLVSLTTFTETVSVYHPMDNDVGALTNIVSDRVDSLRFQPQRETSADAPYPLEEAIITALDQFADVPPGVPRELIIMAAGHPDVALDQPQVQRAITEASTEVNPLTVTVIAFGSAQADNYDRTPANPTALEQLATSADGQYFHFFDETVNTQLREEVEAWFEQLVRRADRYVLRATVDETLSGVQPVQVAANGAVDQTTIELDDLPPRVDVVIDSDTSSLQGTVQLSVHAVFAQSALTEAQYLLNNRPLGTSQEGPNFALTINVYDAEFQQRFPPDEYELVAAVEDARGLQSRSEPRRVSIVPPPQGAGNLFGDNMLLVAGGAIAAGVLLLAIGIGSVIWMRRRRTIGAPEPRGTNRLDDDELSQAIDPDVSTASLEDDLTDIYSDEETEAFDNEKTLYELRFRVRVLEGLREPMEFHLNSKQAHYYIGRTSTNGDRQPDIALPNPKVSRNDHAKLVVLAQGGVELTALKSQNGTFVGDDKQPLEHYEKHVLYHGDVFWISPLVKLRLEED
jgi:pSer/pThr/pTyr-binding forkhead associated (FHA) protein